MTRTFVSLVAAALVFLPDGVPLQGPRAAPFTVTGRVTSTADGAAISGVLINAVGTPHSTITGADGRYRLVLPDDSLRGHELTLRARIIGFQMSVQRVRVQDTTVRADFAMTPSQLRLGEVVVTGAEVAREVRIRGSAVRRIVGAAEGDARAARRNDRNARRGVSGNTEDYDRLVENPFTSPDKTPLSTFSVDVDRASYANVRRFLAQGQLPPKDAVRLEEMVNYFAYDYVAPDGPHPVNVNASVARAPWAPGHQLVRLALQARAVDAEKSPPMNLVFLIDVSGSMEDENKLPLVKRSLKLLVDRLREQDRIAIVVYAGNAGLVLPSTVGNNRATILGVIDRLEAGGSTAGGAGITLAYQVARQNFIRGGNNRVLLATDGDFNVGVSSDGELERLIEEERKSGIFLSVLGFGMGNLKDSRLEKLADKGNGNYAYIDSFVEARKVFVHEMGGTLLTVAKDVKLQVEFNPATVRAYRLLGYENRLLRDQDFNDDRKDAGDMGAGHSVTAFYEIIPAGNSEPVPGVDPLRYQRITERAPALTRHELLNVKIRYKDRDGSTSRLLEVPVAAREERMDEDFAFASAVAELALLLRDSEFRGDASVDRLIARAEESLGVDRFGYRADFVSLARSYRTLARAAAVAPGRR